MRASASSSRFSSRLLSARWSVMFWRCASTASERDKIEPRLFENVTTKARHAITPMKNPAARQPLTQSRIATASKMMAHNAMVPNIIADIAWSIALSACFQPYRLVIAIDTMPHRTTSKPRTLRIGINSLLAQLVEDCPFEPKADPSFRNVLRDQILDLLRCLEIEMLIAAGGAQAAAVNRVGERLLARLACCGSSVELRRQLGPRL